MTEAEFNRYYQEYESVICAIARKIARADDDLFEDLVQTGRITLSTLKPERATDNPDAYIRKAIRNKMADYMRKHKPSRYESLHALLAQGDQVVKGDDGSPKLVRHNPSLDHLPRDPEDEEGHWLRRGVDGAE